ncbi:hypothetical protein LSM04_000672 [Trypanosoma melophagium]|uniref:uncharacterized protein n=1 Tax=Trypanosoma melophagium TaxID=715481 RepID=UPI003519E512|nr:hypothetical protein LSM04_000672 [Trypanosoma melophagium]
MAKYYEVNENAYLSKYMMVIKDANVLWTARRLAFLTGHVEEAYSLLQAHVLQEKSSFSAYREWKEAAITLLSLHSQCDMEKWRSSGLLPLPTPDARAAVGKMDSLTYYHCMLFWTRLSRVSIVQSQQGKEKEEGKERETYLTPREASETLFFLLNNICCVRLTETPRCLPIWRLLQEILAELLLLGSSVISSKSSNANSSSFPISVVQRMADYLRCYIIRYLEMRDRPLEGQCGLLHYRSIFLREFGGMNGGGGGGGDSSNSTNNTNTSEEEEESSVNSERDVKQQLAILSASDVYGALQELCGSDRNSGVEESLALNGILNGDNDTAVMCVSTEIPLEVFIDHYFLRSAPEAFDRVGKTE